MAPLPPDNPDDVFNRRAFALSATTIVLFLSIASYGMRIAARRKQNQAFKSDDWLMGVGLVISFVPAISEYVLCANGLGHHIWNVPQSQTYNFSRASFALQRANQPALVCIKLSILIFYMRLFPSRKFTIAAYANIAFTVAWGIATWIVNLNVCTPIAFFYDRTIPGGSCKDQSISGTISGALSLFGDVVILLLPVPMIWQLQINLRRKIALMGIFLLGTLVCVSSAIRIAFVIQFVASDATYTQVYAACWTYMELGCAVISGNLPLLRPLFEPFFRMRGNTTFGSKGSKGSQPSKLNNISQTGNLSHVVRTRDADGFERMSDDGETLGHRKGTGSDVELCDRNIVVKTDLVVTTESLGRDKNERYKSSW